MARQDQTPDSTRTTSGRKFNGYDALAVLAMAAFATAWHWYCWQGINPFVFLDSDAANIAGFAAAWSHPGYFTKDVLLSNPDNFRFYATIHVPLVRLLYHVFGDYGSVFIYLLGPHIFIQSIGFYLFGRVLFRDRFFAFLLAAFNLRNISIGVAWEFWGIYANVLPRITFQAFLPFLLMAAYAWRHNPRKWFWIMIGAGALVYVHPPSAPGWGLALWLGLWLYAPADWTWRKKILNLFLLGSLFIAVCIPFLMIYLGNHAQGQPKIDYHAVHYVINARFDRAFLDVGFAIRGLLMRMLNSMLLPATVVATVLLFNSIQGSKRKIILIFTWMAGILFTSTAIPFVDQSIANAHHMLPFEIDLVRGLRYVYPLCFILCLWSVSELAGRTRSNSKRAAIYVIAVLGIFGWSIVYRPPWLVKRASEMFITPHFKPLFSKQNEMIDVFRAIKELTPVDSAFYATRDSNPLAVRYAALRPLVFCAKDVGSFTMANPSALPEWYNNRKRMQEIEDMPQGARKWTALLEFAQGLNADYILADFDSSKTAHPGAALIYHNKFYSILKIE